MLNKVQCSNSVGKSSNETSRRLENVSREILNYYDVIYYQKKKKLEPSAILDPPFWINQMHPILLNEPIYMRVGYVLDLSFLEWNIQPISMICGILNK